MKISPGKHSSRQTVRTGVQQHFDTMSRRRFCATLPLLGVISGARHSALAQLVTGVSKLAPQTRGTQSKLELDSSSNKLIDVFEWASRQSMAYAFDCGDPVGPWYEAVEPGREGFCIRDTCHQSVGAHALGLARFTRNMLHRFAENVSDSRDWCSYWEIDRYNRPAPVDYKNDAEFWYNLPANFDLVDCCYRMYVWSGDRTYIEDPVFLNLYDRTVKGYVERWGLDVDHIMQRPRLLNVRGIYDPTKKFVRARGIPGYNEGDHTYLVGLDVLETQRAAYLAYAHIQQARQNAEAADLYLRKAKAVQQLLQTRWWNKAQGCFSARLEPDHTLIGCGARREDAGGSLIWRSDVIADPSDLVVPTDQDAVVERLLDLSHARLEYPEVPFTRIGNIVTRILGLTLEYRSPLLSTTEGGWVEMTVVTMSGLGANIAWAEIRNLPVRDSVIALRHEGRQRTILTNQSGPALIWRPVFEGEHNTIVLNDRPVKTTTAVDANGKPLSFVRVAVGAGDSVEARLNL
ncbi:MAG TPA: hypothetical protein VFA99_18815 [Acidobacteriaceae bacterium]|nr:hypothetical protein [Acidobacteriaceae bacterium]